MRGTSFAHLVAIGEAANCLTSSLRAHLAAEEAANSGTRRAALLVGLPATKWGEVLDAARRSNAIVENVEFRPKQNAENGKRAADACEVEMFLQLGLSENTDSHLNAATDLTSDCCENVRLLMEGPSAGSSDLIVTDKEWFPKSIADLDHVANRVILLDQMNDVSHPSLLDKPYQERRRMFAQLAFGYRHNQSIPLVDYTDEENQTWSVVFNRLCELYDRHACREFLENFRQLRNIGLYRSDRIPQLRDVSDFVRRRSGFTLRPVAGYLSARDFLSALALRVFCCTQYIRHREKPFYTPEPDCCHELLGHVPMLADPAFAHFSQEIGLASLGASDEDVKKLATCYFFTVEFGLCKEAGQLKVFGAGLLSCVDELAHSVSDQATVAEFEPEAVVRQECRITTFQDMYFYTGSFADAVAKIRKFSQSIKRRSQLVYNPFTQSVEPVADIASISRLFERISNDLDVGQQILRNLGR